MNNLLMIGKSSSVGENLVNSLLFSGINFSDMPLPRSRSGAKEIIDATLLNFASRDGKSLILFLSHPKTHASNKEVAIFKDNTMTVFKIAKDLNIPLIYVSSRSCHSRNPSLYAENKRKFEQMATEYGHLVLRIGIYVSNFKSNQTLRQLRLTAQAFRLLGLHKFLSRIYFYETKNSEFVQFILSFFAQTILEGNDLLEKYCSSPIALSACRVLLHPNFDCNPSPNFLTPSPLNNGRFIRARFLTVIRSRPLRRLDPLVNFVAGHR